MVIYGTVDVLGPCPNDLIPRTTVPAYDPGCISLFYNQQTPGGTYFHVKGTIHTAARGRSTDAQEHEISFL
jgi:hypothetical protein